MARVIIVIGLTSLYPETSLAHISFQCDYLLIERGELDQLNLIVEYPENHW